MKNLLRRLLVILSLVSLLSITDTHQNISIQQVVCPGDVNGDLIVDDLDKQIVSDRFDFIENDIFDVVVTAYNIREDCRIKIYLPIVYKNDR